MQKLNDTVSSDSKCADLERQVRDLQAQLKRRDSEILDYRRIKRCQDAALDQLPFGLIALDEHGKTIISNQAFHDLYESDSDANESPSSSSLQYVGLGPAIRNLVEVGDSFNIESVDQDSNLADLSKPRFHGVPFCWGEDNVRGSLIFAEDLADQTGFGALINSRLDHMHGVMMGAVEAMSNLIERRDPFVVGHQRRVAKLACAIAKEIGMDSYGIEGIRIAALLHEVGKVAIPAEILCKPGKLNNAERRIVQTYPVVAQRLLKRIDFPWPVADIILQHKEKLNGSGYPNGLHDDEIMVQAKVLGLADVVEAMLTIRPYRPAYSQEEVLEEVRNQSGITYDPTASQACLNLFLKKDFTF
ncbi:MAG: HD domain-containing protein [bacterium]|nr:HD domain-containing protein [bacterium]